MTVTIWPLPALDIALDSMECSYSEYIATMRLADVERHRRKNRADLVIGDSERANHMLGALGEHAFAKWLGVRRAIDGQWGICPVCGCYAGTVNTFHEGADVGRYQVRTRSNPHSPLIVRESDRDDDVFVLVTVHENIARAQRIRRDPHGDSQKIRLGLAIGGGIYDHFDIVGWISGADAKSWERKRDPGGRGVAFFVPQEELREIITLPLDSAPTRSEEAHDERTEGLAAERDADVGTDAGSRSADAEQARRERGEASLAADAREEVTRAEGR